MSADRPTADGRLVAIVVAGVLGLALVAVVTVGSFGLSAMATDPCGTRADDPECFARAARISRGVLVSGAAGVVALVVTTLWPRLTRTRRTRTLGLLAVPVSIAAVVVFLSTPLS